MRAFWTYLSIAGFAFVMSNESWAQTKSDGKSGGGQSTGSFRAAFVDMQSAILQTEEGKQAKAKIEKEAESKRQDILNQEKELKKLDDEFQAQSGVLSEEAKRNKQTEFQTKLQKLQAARLGFEQEVRQKEMQETQKILPSIVCSLR